MDEFLLENFEFISRENNETFISDLSELYPHEFQLLEKFFKDEITKKKQFVKLIGILDKYEYKYFEEYVVKLILKYKTIKTNFCIRYKFKNFIKQIKALKTEEEIYDYCCSNGYLNIIKKFNSNYDSGLILAMKNNQLELVKYLVSKIKSFDGEYLKFACQNTKIAELFIPHYEHKFIFQCSFENDNLELVKIYYKQDYIDEQWIINHCYKSIKCLEWLKTQIEHVSQQTHHRLILNSFKTENLEIIKYHVNSSPSLPDQGQIRWNMWRVCLNKLNFDVQTVRFLVSKNLYVLSDSTFYKNLKFNNIEVAKFIDENVVIKNLSLIYYKFNLEGAEYLIKTRQFKKYEFFELMKNTECFKTFRYLSEHVNFEQEEIEDMFMYKICRECPKMIRFMHRKYDIKIKIYHVSLVIEYTSKCINFSSETLSYLIDNCEESSIYVIHPSIYQSIRLELLQFLDEKFTLNRDELLTYYSTLSEDSIKFLVSKGAKNKFAMFHSSIHDFKKFKLMIENFSKNDPFLLNIVERMKCLECNKKDIEFITNNFFTN